MPKCSECRRPNTSGTEKCICGHTSSTPVSVVKENVLKNTAASHNRPTVSENTTDRPIEDTVRTMAAKLDQVLQTLNEIRAENSALTRKNKELEKRNAELQKICEQQNTCNNSSISLKGE